MVSTIGINVGATPRFARRHVPAAIHVGRVHEVVAQVRNILQKQFLMSKRNVAEKHKVLVNLSHVAHVRHEAHRELSGEHRHGEPFTDAGQARTVGLHDAARTSLQKIFP